MGEGFRLLGGPTKCIRLYLEAVGLPARRHAGEYLGDHVDGAGGEPAVVGQVLVRRVRGHQVRAGPARRKGGRKGQKDLFTKTTLTCSLNFKIKLH